MSLSVTPLASNRAIFTHQQIRGYVITLPVHGNRNDLGMVFFLSAIQSEIVDTISARGHVSSDTANWGAGDYTQLKMGFVWLA